jgi:hypothetical protein
MQGTEMIASNVFKSLALLILQERIANYKEVTFDDHQPTTLEGFREWDVSDEIVMEYCKHWSGDIADILQDLTNNLPSDSFTQTDQIPLSRHFGMETNESFLDSNQLTLAEVNARLRAKRASKHPSWLGNAGDLGAFADEFFETLP